MVPNYRHFFVTDLNKDRTPVRIVVLVLPVPNPLTELVTKAQPLLLYQDHEPSEGPVVTVQHQHGQGGQLAGPVPSITAVDNHTGPVDTHLVEKYFKSRLEWHIAFIKKEKSVKKRISNLFVTKIKCKNFKF